MIICDQEGSPPRMRGKDTKNRGVYRLAGITPAYAGKRAQWQLRCFWG